MAVVLLHRTLEQELLALERGASMECLVCGEFVMTRAGVLVCPECGSVLTAARGVRAAQLHFDVETG
jgi:Zn finger protein HypA/HybF involved in hydrogenase expression